jgi:hypothetical protein
MYDVALDASSEGHSVESRDDGVFCEKRFNFFSFHCMKNKNQIRIPQTFFFEFLLKDVLAARRSLAKSL